MRSFTTVYNFDNMEKTDTLDLCINFSSNLHYYSSDRVYIQNRIRSVKTNEEYIKEYILYINQKNQIRILQLNAVHSNASNANTCKIVDKMQLQYYNGMYCAIDLPSVKLHDTIQLQVYNPRKNEYIDSKAQIFPNLDYEKPILVDKRTWFGAVSVFNEPMVYIDIQFINQKIISNVTDYIKLHLTCEILNYLGMIVLYNAELLKYNFKFSIDTLRSSFNISCSCLNDTSKIVMFMKQLFNFIKDIHIHLEILSDEYILNLLLEFKRNRKNIVKVTPVKYTHYILSLLYNPNEYTYDMILSALETLTVKDIKLYISKFTDILNLSYMTQIVYGNIKYESIPEINAIINKFSKNNNNNIKKFTIKEFWSDEKKLIIPHPNKDEKSNSILRYYNVGLFSIKSFVLLLMTIDILHDPFFDVLRTQKQLGYYVRMQRYSIIDMNAVVQHIQSDKPYDIVLKEIDAFNKSIFDYIKEEKMSEYKDRIKDLINSVDTSISECYSKYNHEIINKTFMFNKKELLLSYVQKINYKDLGDFIRCVFNEKNCVTIIINGR